MRPEVRVHVFASKPIETEVRLNMQLHAFMRADSDEAGR